MSEQKRTKYAVQAASLSEAIHVGTIAKSGREFAEKEDLTDMVLAAVAQYVERNFAGGMEATFPGIGLLLRVHVEPLAISTPDETETDEQGE